MQTRFYTVVPFQLPNQIPDQREQTLVYNKWTSPLTEMLSNVLSLQPQQFAIAAGAVRRTAFQITQ